MTADPPPGDRTPTAAPKVAYATFEVHDGDTRPSAAERPQAGDDASAGRLLVFGDIGGHADAFAAKLAEHGIDSVDPMVPIGDLLVCVGDLVDTGPDSTGVLDLVERLIDNNGSRLVIEAGNHEQNLLGRVPTFLERRPLQPADADRVRRMWADGHLRAATAVDIAGIEVRGPGGARRTIGSGGVLITHAGLTSGLWDLLGRPRTAHDTAEAINLAALDLDGPIWAPGVMLTRTPNWAAGTVWASAQSELYPSWMLADEPLPFHQIHGHTSAWNFTTSKAWEPHPRVAHVPRPALHIDAERRHVRTEIKGQVIWGCDPGHGRYGARTWQPIVLERPDL